MKLSFRSSLLTLFSLLSAIVLLGSCGGGSGPPKVAPETTQSATQSSADESDLPGSSGSSAICRDNTLLTYGGEPATVLDPILVSDIGTAEYIIEIFSGLVTLSLDLTVEPDLAASWKVSDDALTYTFTLRENAVFHNGRRVTAEDFKYSIERAADPANASPTVLLYLSEIVGVKEKFRGLADSVRGVVVIDDLTIQISLTEPIAHFLQVLTYPVAFVVDKEQLTRDPVNWTRNPNGTGPFRLRTFNPLEEIVLARNDRYHLDPPKLDAVVFNLSGGSLSTRYENDEIHVALVPTLELDSYREGKSRYANEYRVAKEMSLSYIAFNVNMPPFDDPLVRQALALAVDRNAINEVLYYNRFRVADGILPPEMPGYNEDISSYPYDPQRAADLIAKSKYAGNMPRITLNFPGSAASAGGFLEVFQQQWSENLGLDVELEAVEWSTFLRELRRKTFQVASLGWIADYPDPENFLHKLFSSGSTQNELGYSNSKVDELLEEARVEWDNTRRNNLFWQAEQIILDDAAVIPIFWSVQHLLVKPCVQNWPDLSIGVPKYRYITIEVQ
ncbi:MAG: ABC transporter substrate-binding protein [Tepidiformaceae bacterium]